MAAYMLCAGYTLHEIAKAANVPYEKVVTLLENEEFKKTLKLLRQENAPSVS